MNGPAVVMSAMQAEHRLLIEHIASVERINLGSITGVSGTLDDRDVILIRAGVGKVATGAAVGLTWERFRGRVFIFSGVAGGLSPDLDIGDVVVGERTIQHDAGVLGPRGLERYQAGHIPFFNPTDDFGYSPSPQLLDQVRRTLPDVELQPVLGRLPKVRLGTIVTGDQYLTDEDTKQRLHSELRADAIEMEGAAMAQAAGLVGADHIVIRALSDLAGGDSIDDFRRYVTEVSENTSAIVRALLRTI